MIVAEIIQLVVEMTRKNLDSRVREEEDFMGRSMLISR